MGIFNAFTVILSYLMEPYEEFDALDASLVGSVPIFAGIIGAIVMSK